MRNIVSTPECKVTTPTVRSIRPGVLFRYIAGSPAIAYIRGVNSSGLICITSLASGESFSKSVSMDTPIQVLNEVTVTSVDLED